MESKCQVNHELLKKSALYCFHCGAEIKKEEPKEDKIVKIIDNWENHNYTKRMEDGHWTSSIEIAQEIWKFFEGLVESGSTIDHGGDYHSIKRAIQKAKGE